MLSIDQCRGARGLLNWTQQDLADASGLSKTAINNFEKGHSDIKTESLKAIRIAFESADIEFLDNDGLRKRADNARILSGPTPHAQLIRDIAEAVQKPQCDLMVFYCHSKFNSQDLFSHTKKLAKSQRVICPEGQIINDLNPNQYRWAPKNALNACMTTYIYGSKVAFELRDRTTILIVESQDAYEAERNRFEHLWQDAIPPNIVEFNQEQQSA